MNDFPSVLLLLLLLLPRFMPRPRPISQDFEFVYGNAHKDKFLSSDEFSQISDMALGGKQHTHTHTILPG